MQRIPHPSRSLPRFTKFRGTAKSESAKNLRGPTMFPPPFFSHVCCSTILFALQLLCTPDWFYLLSFPANKVCVDSTSKKHMRDSWGNLLFGSYPSRPEICIRALTTGCLSQGWVADWAVERNQYNKMVLDSKQLYENPQIVTSKCMILLWNFDLATQGTQLHVLVCQI